MLQEFFCLPKNDNLTENAPIQNNSVVGAGKHVINDIKNNPTQKIKREKTIRFPSVCFYPLRVFYYKRIERERHINAMKIIYNTARYVSMKFFNKPYFDYLCY